jgi:endonuclease YncB( thermonuclease family)
MRIIFLATLAVVTVATGISQSTSADASAASTIVTIDGDTLKDNGETIRIVDIDVPESFKSRCDAAFTLALEAMERLQQLVGTDNVRIDRSGTDRYGRNQHETLK